MTTAVEILHPTSQSREVVASTDANVTGRTTWLLADDWQVVNYRTDLTAPPSILMVVPVM